MRPLEEALGHFVVVSGGVCVLCRKDGNRRVRKEDTGVGEG